MRTAVGLSVATGRPCRIHSIRAGRADPGLKAQHLAGIRGAARLCGARVEGAHPGSQKLVFEPGPLDPPEQLRVQVETAGAVTLVLQTLMVPLATLRDPMEIIVTGGTHVLWAPTVDYFVAVFSYYLERMGVMARVLNVEPGFYPAGGGMLHVVVSPAGLAPQDITVRGAFRKVLARSLAASELRRSQVVERQLVGAARVLALDWENEEYRRSRSVGSAIHIMAEYANCRLGASCLGERGKRAEIVGVEAAGLLDRWMSTGACLDEYMADQILPYLAMAGGTSRVRVAAVTDHCRTNIWVIEKFLPVRFTVDEREGLITCVASGPPAQGTGVR